MTISLVLSADEALSALPQEEDFMCWAEAALAALPEEPSDSCEISIRLMNNEESAALNAQYRQKQGPTNILSFPAGPLPGIPGMPRLLGDLALCVPVIEQEAAAQNKTLEAHFAHLTIHGVLHLCGYDHEAPDEAEQMEGLETRIVTGLGFPAPYA